MHLYVAKAIDRLYRNRRYEEDLEIACMALKRRADFHLVIPGVRAVHVLLPGVTRLEFAKALGYVEQNYLGA